MTAEQQHLVEITLAGVVGLVIGSFLNVVAYRLPRGESLIRPASRCPECERPIRPHHNIPVLSWLLLRGRCRDCGARIPVSYPLVEALCGILFAATITQLGVTAQGVLGCVLIGVLIPISIIDLKLRIIPNTLQLFAFCVGIVAFAAFDTASMPERLIAAAGAFGVFLLTSLLWPGGMGMGDVKLAGVMGLYLGVSVIPAIMIALLTGAVVGVMIMTRTGVREGRKLAVPFGPFLAFGAVCGLWFGPELIGWYTTSFMPAS
jgi:leader peptidase (prepilin peptidase)/N-methyltransferase